MSLLLFTLTRSLLEPGEPSVPTIDPETEEATSPTTPGEPELEKSGPGGGNGDYRVILYNDDWHGFDEVALQLQKATGYSQKRCAQITMEVDRKGRAICYRANREKCHKAARVLREIRLQCEVDCD